MQFGKGSGTDFSGWAPPPLPPPLQAEPGFASPFRWIVSLCAAARRESDEEFRARLLGSDRPQDQRVLTGVDPRLAAAEEGEEGGGGGGDTWGTRLDKLDDAELSPEDREAKRNTELWKGGNKAKEFGYKWKVSARTAADCRAEV